MATMPAPPVIASPMDDPQYASEEATLVRLKRGRDVIDEKLRAAEASLHALLITDLDEAAALALIADQDDSEMQIDALSQTVEKLRRKQAIFRRAIAIQRGKLAGLAEELSADAAFAALPEHKEAVRRILSAMAAFAAAKEAERTVRADLAERGFSVQLQAMTPPFGYNPNELTHSMWRENARRYVG